MFKFELDSCPIFDFHPKHVSGKIPCVFSKAAYDVAGGWCSGRDLGRHSSVKCASKFRTYVSMLVPISLSVTEPPLFHRPQYLSRISSLPNFHHTGVGIALPLCQNLYTLHTCPSITDPLENVTVISPSVWEAKLASAIAETVINWPVLQPLVST